MTLWCFVGYCHIAKLIFLGPFFALHLAILCIITRLIFSKENTHFLLNTVVVFVERFEHRTVLLFLFLLSFYLCVSHLLVTKIFIKEALGTKMGTNFYSECKLINTTLRHVINFLCEVILIKLELIYLLHFQV